MPTEFFLIVAPGLEGLASEELKTKWPLIKQAHGEGVGECPEVRQVPGGLGFPTEPPWGWLLNHYLKIPTRILQRLAEFQAKDFPRLHNQLRKIPWHLYLRQGKIEVKVASHESRLVIKRRIEEVFEQALAESTNHQPLRQAQQSIPQAVYLRLVQDTVTVSIDTSGESLYLRGTKPLSVEAPVRETLASALYFLALRSSGITPRMVVDPYCGSGTLVFEALAFWRSARGRHFAYQQFPSAPEQMKFNLKLDLRDESDLAGVGMDINPTAITAAERNAQIFSKRYGGSLQWIKGDCTLAQSIQAPRPCFFLTNPPYGERLKVNLGLVAKDLRELLERWHPEVLAVLWPEQEPIKLTQDYRWLAKVQTTNGGLPILLAIAGRS